MSQILTTRAMYNRNLKRWLRYQLKDWRESSLRKANYTCFITGKKSSVKHHLPLDVHHLDITFDTILHEALDALGLAFHKLTTDYTPEELEQVLQEVKRRHQDTPYLVLSRNAHENIHRLYGSNPTMEEIREYKRSYNTRRRNCINGQKKRK
jgi:hypothetical protein